MAAKTPKDWARIDNGAFVHMRKPYSFNRDDWHLEIILARWEGGAQDWVTWLYNRADGSCSGGHYFDTREQALSDFKDRGHVKLMTHNQEPVEDLPPGNWEKVSKPPALGSDQAGVLRVIKEKRSWYIGCGWNWATLSRTRRIMASLVKKGLVQIEEGQKGTFCASKDVYILAPHAHELFEKKPGSNYWKYKDGAIQELARPKRW